IQPSKRFRGSEDTRRKRATIDFTSLCKDALTEFADHRVVRFPASRQHGMAELVGMDHQAAPAGERFRDEAFAAGEAPGESDFQHLPHRRSAASTVFAMSMAMVSGPTPPGTGVYAEARSTTSSGCTSPTRIPPRLSNTASFSGELRKM